jgi:hypothetical protein
MPYKEILSISTDTHKKELENECSMLLTVATSAEAGDSKELHFQMIGLVVKYDTVKM